MDSPEQLRLKNYYASLSDQALDEAYCLGPEGYRDSDTWRIVEDEYSSRGLIGSRKATRSSLFETYYDVLDISAGATEQDVKKAYRTQALRWHPDRNNGSSESEDRFKRIAEAYQVLSNPVQRRSYDEALALGSSRPVGRAMNLHAAAELFMQEMTNLAAELALQNLSPRDIQLELRRRGCPPLIAARLGRSVTSWRENLVRRSVWENLHFRFFIIPGIVIALIMLLFGSHDVERLLIYLVIVGGPLIYYFVTGRAPSR